MVRRWRFLAIFLRPVFAASRVQHVSDLHLKFALRRHTTCGSMADFQSATAEIRLGKKEERKKKPLGKNIMVCPITWGDHKKSLFST